MSVISACNWCRHLGRETLKCSLGCELIIHHTYAEPVDHEECEMVREEVARFKAMDLGSKIDK